MIDVQANLPPCQIREFYEASWRLTKAIQEFDVDEAHNALEDMMRCYHRVKRSEDVN